MKIANCLCRQCRLSSRRRQTYLNQRRAARRNVKERIRYETHRKAYNEIDPPKTYRGKYAA